jgi:acetolactate synthase I/III small subunit
MSMPTLDARAGTEPTRHFTVLELIVQHHPGVMAQVSGLCARRVFHVEGWLYLPDGNGIEGRLWLRVPEDQRLAQVIKQLQRLEDVLDIRRHDATDAFAVAAMAFLQA